MSSENKGLGLTTYTEVDPQDIYYQKHQKKIRMVDAARVGLTLLSLLCGFTVLGTSADTLATYNSTHLTGDFHLPLWPDQFDLRPTIALVVGSCIVVLASVVSLLFSKVQVVSNDSHATNLSQAKSASASQPGDSSYVSHLYCAFCQFHGCNDQHDLLLCGQRLYHGGHSAELELSMGICKHECKAALWHLVQGKPDCSVPVRHPGTC